MIRLAVPSDIPGILEIRDSAHEDPLSDPNSVTEAGTGRFINSGFLWVWEEAEGRLTGFCAGDVRDGSVWALLVAPGHEGEGIGRALLKTACEALRAAGHRYAVLTVAPGTQAERHYRAAGWIVTGTNHKGDLVFQKPL